MSHSITYYVDVTVDLEGQGVQAAGFGTPMFFYQHAVTANRLDGPYLSAAAVLDAGHVAGSPAHDYALAHFAQNPRARQMYIGRLDAGDANLTAGLTAIYNANRAAWYCAVPGEDHRDAQSILDLAAFIETLPKIAIAQSNDASLLAGEGPSYSAVIGGTAADATYRLTFTGFGLGAPVNVDVVRAAGVPATNDDLAAAMRTALTTAAGGSLSGELVTASIGGATNTVLFRMADGLPTGTVTQSVSAGTGTITVTVTDADIGSRMFDLQYQRTALVYRATDTNYLTAAWAARCLSFDLDVKKGSWAYKQLVGQEPDALLDSEVSALRNVNCNYFARAQMSAGNETQAFTAQGWMPYGTAGAGRRIDVTTTIDWAKARFEEAFTNVLLRETHDIGFTDAGINRFVAASNGVLETGIKAGHFTPFVVPEGDSDFEPGLVTPKVFAPSLRETTVTQRTNRELTMSAVAYLRSGIERVVFTLNVKQ